MIRTAQLDVVMKLREQPEDGMIASGSIEVATKDILWPWWVPSAMTFTSRSLARTPE